VRSFTRKKRACTKSEGLYRFRRPMKEHPILFSSEMVMAILEGRKTQTRRAIKRQPIYLEGVWIWRRTEWLDDKIIDPSPLDLCPYGYPGDQLWVREAWAPQVLEDGRKYKSGDSVIYRADFCGEALDYPWRPSIFMPRWASRIMLEIVNIRVERVQQIGGTDAFAEGGFTVTQFIELWDKLNAKRYFLWESNPWVWVIEFKKSNEPPG
jgi:hypothetical protein